MTLLPIHPLRAYVCTVAPAFLPCGALTNQHRPLTERQTVEVKAISADGAVFEAEKITGRMAVACRIAQAQATHQGVAA